MKTKLFTGLIIALLFTGGIVSACQSKTQPEQPVITQSDKSDGECTGNETAGRCADKPFVECPYAEQIAVDSPKCVAPVEPTPIPIPEPAPVVQVEQPVFVPFQGK